MRIGRFRCGRRTYCASLKYGSSQRSTKKKSMGIAPAWQPYATRQMSGEHVMIPVDASVHRDGRVTDDFRNQHFGEKKKKKREHLA